MQGKIVPLHRAYVGREVFAMTVIQIGPYLWINPGERGQVTETTVDGPKFTFDAARDHPSLSLPFSKLGSYPDTRPSPH